MPRQPSTKASSNDPLPLLRPGPWLAIPLMLILFVWFDRALSSDSPVLGDSQPVFHPNDTQHGFAEYDTPPDFPSDNAPSPYKSYSQSPFSPSADHKPGGVFLSLDFAENYEVEPTIRGGHTHVPVHPTDSFSPQVPSVYLVFSVHEHLSSYQIIGRLFPETETELDSPQWLDEDIVDLATEDESGYLKFFPPGGSWQSGRYRVQIFVGFAANAENKMGAMRFTILPTSTPPSLP